MTSARVTFRNLPRGLRLLPALLLMALLPPLNGADNNLRNRDQFVSAGKAVRVETFRPADGGTAAPSVIVLHGSTGVAFANRFIAGVADQFAQQGFVVHLVHYFDSTSTSYADDATIARSSKTWLQAVSDAVEWVAEQRPKAKIGIFGYSLGGYLGAAESIADSRISAAVILAGGLDEGSSTAVKHAPPMLILHGGNDSRVPLSEARRLEAALIKAGRTPEFHVYPGEDHILSMPSYADVVRRGAEFFRRKLK